MPTFATQSGSGLVISEDGLVVTNAHVVASSMGGDEPFMITLTDGRRFSAKVRRRRREWRCAAPLHSSFLSQASPPFLPPFLPSFSERRRVSRSRSRRERGWVS